jgi:phage terminase large subunit-like protein
MSGNRSYLVVRALEQIQSAVVDKELTHDGSRALTRHILNARRRIGRSGLTIAKEHPDSRNKIDAAIAATLAYQARLQALSKGEATKSTFIPRRIR